MWFRRLKPTPDCRIWRWVPSPQSTRKRYSSCFMIWAERPRWTEGAEAEVPRNTISNKAGAFREKNYGVLGNEPSAPRTLNCTPNEPYEIPDHFCYNHPLLSDSMLKKSAIFNQKPNASPQAKKTYSKPSR